MTHYKSFQIVKSNKVEGMYMTTCEFVVGWSIEEVMYDIDDTAQAYEYDQEVKATKSLLNSFKGFLNN
jgi:hypothetical protein